MRRNAVNADYHAANARADDRIRAKEPSEVQAVAKVDVPTSQNRSAFVLPPDRHACRTLAFAWGIDPATKKAAQLFHPRRQRWSRHFRWSEDCSHLEGLNRIGRVTIERLALNNEYQLEARKR